MKKIFLLFSLIVTLSFTLWSQTQATEPWYVFKGHNILQGVNKDSLKIQPTVKNSPIYAETFIQSPSSWKFFWNMVLSWVNYTNHLNTIIRILYQILLVVFFVGFFHLVWLFYTFFNDILWKK